MGSTNENKRYRRKYPRKALRKRIGVLFAGQYFICESSEIGEGGMSVVSDFAFSEGREVVVTFQIPEGSFVSLRGEVRSVTAQQGRVHHGVAFSEIPFGYKREIRSFVSARTSFEKQNQ